MDTPELKIDGKSVTSIAIDGKEVTRIEVDGSIIYSNGAEPVLPDYLYVMNTSDTSGAFTITKGSMASASNKSVEYSFDMNEWETIDLTESFSETVPSGGTIYLRGKCPNGLNGDSYVSSNSDSYVYKISMNVEHSAGGNLMSIIDYEDIGNITHVPNGAFRLLFDSDTYLIDASNLNVDGADEVLSYGMFAMLRYSGVTAGPEFESVTTLGDYAMSEIMKQCQSLVESPKFNSIVTIGRYGISDALLENNNLEVGPVLENVQSVDAYSLGGIIARCPKVTVAPNIGNVTSVNGNSFASMLISSPNVQTVYAPNIGSWSTITFNAWVGDNAGSTAQEPRLMIFKTETLMDQCPSGNNGYGNYLPVTAGGLAKSPTISQSKNTVTITGKYIYYTTDGTTPTTDSPYSAGTKYIYLSSSSSNVTVKAICSVEGYSSQVVEFEAEYRPVCSTPVISHADNEITITCSTDDVTIYRSKDAGFTGYVVYDGPFRVTRSGTVRAYAVKSGYWDSNTATYSHTFVEMCDTPAITFDGADGVSITTGIPGCTIYYTTDGTTPTTSSDVYAEKLHIEEETQFKAFAAKSGYIDSHVAEETITPSFICTDPAITCESNTVSIISYPDGCTIYYTTDGTTPTTSSNIYNSPFAITETVTVKAYAVKPGFTDSRVVTDICEILDTDYFRFNDLSGSANTMTMKYTRDSGKPDPTFSLEYSTDGGSTWTSFTFSASNMELSVEIPANGSLLMRGTGNTDLSVDEHAMYSFDCTGNYKVSGHISTIFNGTDYTPATVHDWTFIRMFRESTTLVNAEDLIFNVVPGSSCGWTLNGVFSDCINLEGRAPDIPNLAGTYSSWAFNGYAERTKVNELWSYYSGSSNTPFVNFLGGTPAGGTYHYIKGTPTSYVPSNWSMVAIEE